jgi:peptidoglycan/LPS O-acetylase OafA/YrhL
MSTGQTERAGSLANMPAQLDSLTGLRWVAAFMVFLSHVVLTGVLPQDKVGESIGTVVALGGYVGVAVFFVLSGFVLTWSARTTDTAPRFWRRRFFKVYPNHFVAFLVATAFMMWLGQNFGFPPISDQLPGAVPQLLLVQAWLPDLNLAFAFNPVSWSLSVEALFYLCFPLLLAGISRIRAEKLWYWLAGTVLLVFCFPLIAKLLPAGEAAYEGLGSWEYWFIYVLPITRMAEFALGIMLARMVLAGRWPRVPLWLAGLVFVAGYALALNVPKNYAIVAAMVIPIVLLIPAAGMADTAGTARRPWLATPFLVWLGNISYAFYLVHFFAIASIGSLLPSDFQPSWPAGIAFVAGTLVWGVVVSWVMYRFIERPMQRRFSVSRKQAAAESPAPTSGLV